MKTLVQDLRDALGLVKFLDWRARSHAFRGLAGFRADHTMLSGAGPEMLRSAQLSSLLFSVAPTDPTTLGAVFLAVVDPATVLRSEQLA